DELGTDLGAVLIGSGVEPLAPRLGELGADVVYLADEAAFGDYEGESYARLAEQAIRRADPAIVLLGQTLNGRDVAARLAFRLETALGTDCTALRLDQGQLVMTKPVYGGNALAGYVRRDARPQRAPIRPRAFEPAVAQSGRPAE